MRTSIKRTLTFRVVEPARHRVEHAIARLGARPVVRICVASDDRVYTSEQQIAPLREYRDALRSELGVVLVRMLVKDALALSARQLRAFDAVLLKLAFTTPPLEALGVVRTLRERAGRDVKILYLDGDDDVCVQWPALLPYVDLYVKKQVFARASEYGLPRIGKTNLTDYVARRFGTSFRSDRVPTSRGVDAAQIPKIALGWNVALDDKIRALARRPPPSGGKDVDVICRASVDERAWVHPLRSPVVAILRELSAEYRVLTPEHRVSQEEYYEEMRRARICVSPFGYGEVCWRDFEAVLCGCLLVKPDMSHLRTDPDVFVPFETYVPVRWDFADLAGILRHYLARPDERERISRRAREVLLSYDERWFVARFAELLAAAGIVTRARGAARAGGMTR